jgi:hypothetical protein
MYSHEEARLTLGSLEVWERTALRGESVLSVRLAGKSRSGRWKRRRVSGIFVEPRSPNSRPSVRIFITIVQNGARQQVIDCLLNTRL